MRYILLIVQTLILSANIFSQVTLNIAEIDISNIKLLISPGIDYESEGLGPDLYFTCVIVNENVNELVIEPSKAKIRILYNFRGNVYDVFPLALPFVDNDSVIISGKNKIEFSLYSQSFLVGTPLFDEECPDYSRLLLEIIPTIRVEYKDPNNKFVSDFIEKVKVED